MRAGGREGCAYLNGAARPGGSKLSPWERLREARIRRQRGRSPTGDGPSKMARMTPQSASPTFLAVDFYCGAGGTTRGLIDAGGYVIAGIDNDPSCSETYTTNNPNLTLDGKPPTYLKKDMLPATWDYPAAGRTRSSRTYAN